MSELQPRGHGLYWQDLKVGDKFVTFGRTITEPDIVSFVGLAGLIEPIFVDETYRRSKSYIKGRVVPGALVNAIAEGLTLLATLQGTGMAFLGMTLDITGPTVAGDTIHVEVEVLEIRPTSKGNRAIVKTRNTVINQKGETVMVYLPVRMLKGRPGAGCVD